VNFIALRRIRMHPSTGIVLLYCPIFMLQYEYISLIINQVLGFARVAYRRCLFLLYDERNCKYLRCEGKNRNGNLVRFLRSKFVSWTLAVIRSSGTASVLQQERFEAVGQSSRHDRPMSLQNIMLCYVQVGPSRSLGYLWKWARTAGQLCFIKGSQRCKE
jgi:hypothetical protein